MFLNFKQESTRGKIYWMSDFCTITVYPYTMDINEKTLEGTAHILHTCAHTHTHTHTQVPVLPNKRAKS